jgi:hypothetical protein
LEFLRLWIKTSIDLSIGNYASAIVGNSKILCRAKSFIGFTAFVWSNQSRNDLKLAKPVENTYELVSHKTFIILVFSFFFQFAANYSILSIKNGNDNVRIEDNCLEEELATTPILSEIRTLSLTFVMLMRFFARLNIYYKTFLTRMQCDTTPFTSCCHNVDFCIAFLRQSANNSRHCSFCAQISPVVLKNKQ